MDDLYDHLDNYNEESTIAELREENKDLKLKLEEYASTLDKLQKDFDIISSEHKQLELNYSSLLKTARSEIERKTQIITKLNIEKDAMVLGSMQNRKSSYYGRKKNQINNKMDSGFEKQIHNYSDNSCKPFTDPVPDERAGSMVYQSENLRTPDINTNTPRTNIQTRLLDLVNKTMGIPKLNTAKNNEMKENCKIDNDAERSRAQISSRRKSMPVSSMDCAKFSSDEDEVASTESAKESINIEPERKNLDRFPTDKPSMEDKMSGHLRETRNRFREYDCDKYRSREKYDDSQRHRRNHSPERRKCSPEKRGSSDRKRGSPDIRGRVSLDRRKFNLDKRKVSPDKRRVSPDKRRVSPDKRRVSPDRRRVSPDKRRVSPDKRRGSPDRRRVSSDKRRVSPDKRRISPDKRRVSPDRRRLSSDKKRFSPSRRMFSPDRRRVSPDGYQKRPRDISEENYQRQEYDRHRRLISPSKDKSYDYKLRDQKTQRLYDRNHPHDFDTYKSHNQDIYPMKHKIPHDYEEPSKRMRIDSKHHLEERRRVVVEPDLPYLHNMSCQSPEYIHTEAQHLYPIREIKLNATTKLEDPRISSKKYFLRAHHGKPELCTVDSANIDVKVLDTSNWSMNETMKMPDALLQKPDSTVLPSSLLQTPMSTAPSDHLEKKSSSPDMPHTLTKKPTSPDMPHALANTLTSDIPDASPQTSTELSETCSQKVISIDMPDILTQKPISTDTPMPNASKSTDALINEIYMDIENPGSNISIESGEIYDYDDIQIHSPETDTRNRKIENIRHHVVEPKETESLPKLSNYKIPKKKSVDPQIPEICKIDVSSDKLKLKSNLDAKMNDKTLTETSNKQEKSPKHKKRKITQRRNSDFQYEFQNYVTSKEIIGDLELSDETSDNADIQIQHQTKTVLNNNEELINCESSDTKLNEPKPLEQPKQSIERDKTIQKHVKQTLEEKSKETMVKDKKSKKKSPKLKESKKQNKDSDAAFIMDKPAKSKENSKESEGQDTSLSMDQLVKMKEKLTKQLENKDKSQDKPVKKKENKSKISPEIKGTVPPKNKSVKKKEITEIESTAVIVDKQSKQEEKAKEPSKDTEVMDNPVKKKETKTKELNEQKNGKRQQSKPKESSETKEHTATNKNKMKGYKTNKTKFNELFGDSSSLVSPEDLGLIHAIVPKENYVPIFEDAQDAIDITTFKTTVPSALTEKEITLSKDDAHINLKMNLDCPVLTARPIQTSQEFVPTESVQSIYQNLEPDIPASENEIVKTVIISSGIQPQFTSEATETSPVVNDKSKDLHVMQCVKPTVLQGMVIQALATSTPQKQQNVHAEMDPKTNSRCASNECRDTIVEKTPAIDNSDNTNTSQTNDPDEPDMKIFVKRRKKVLKKK